MKQYKDRRKTASLRERFQYWFDNRMTKGSLGFIHVLIVFSILLAVVIALVIISSGFNEENSNASVIWNSIATVINAWMPSYEDGSPGYVILMAVVALAGVLFTSVLIGIFTTAIEEKIEDLKRGNSLVLENGHTVILGFYPGEYTLIQQLILSAAGRPACIVIAEDMDRENMEHDIEDNLDVPRNFRIVCRTADITDPSSIEKCSVETSREVIITPTGDERTLKTVLAVSTLLQEKNVSDVRVNAIISRDEYKLPVSLAEKHNISTLQTNVIIAKMIAHSCTQTGLSETFREVFNFEGNEFYLVNVPQAAGWTFRKLMSNMDHAVPAGICRNNKVLINPSGDDRIQENDRILIFAEQSDSVKIVDEQEAQDLLTAENDDSSGNDLSTEIVVFGYNETIPVILEELPENVSCVHFVGVSKEGKTQRAAQKTAAARGISLDFIDKDPHDEEDLVSIAMNAEHLIILNDHEKESEAADMEAIFLLVNLRDIRERYGLGFNITVEMQKEKNQNLVGAGDHSDFLVASSMASLILAQIAESPDLIGVFREILSNEGNELYLKNPELLHVAGSHTVQDLRLSLLHKGYILLGILDQEKSSAFNLPLDASVQLTAQDNLIVLAHE